TVVGREPAPPDVEVKPIESVVSNRPLLDPHLLSLTRFAAEYYLCSWGEAIEAALPPRGGVVVLRKYRRAREADPEPLPARAFARKRALLALPADGSAVDRTELPEAERSQLPTLVRLGLAEIVEEEEGPGPEPAERLEIRPGPVPSAAQTAVLERLAPSIRRG